MSQQSGLLLKIIISAYFLPTSDVFVTVVIGVNTEIGEWFGRMIKYKYGTSR
jgi:hypothetical protein